LQGYIWLGNPSQHERYVRNSYGSSLMILAVKIYEAAVEALRKKERQDETQFTTKIDGFLSFIPC